MHQNSTIQRVISKEEIEKLVGTEQSNFFNNLSPLALLLLKDEYSEENIKVTLAEALKEQNNSLPTTEEVESLYKSLKKIAAYIDQQKTI